MKAFEKVVFIVEKVVLKKMLKILILKSPRGNDPR
jgi:hypothetical protein